MYFKLNFESERNEHEHTIAKCSLCIFKLDMSDLCLRLVRISKGLI